MGKVESSTFHNCVHAQSRNEQLASSASVNLVLTTIFCFPSTLSRKSNELDGACAILINPLANLFPQNIYAA